MKSEFQTFTLLDKKTTKGQEDHALIEKLSNVYQVGLKQLKNYIEINGKNN